jgi:hypothetical protein
MSQTRKCKYCKQEIDKNVTVCPHCQKKQGVGCLTSAIVSIMVFLLVFLGVLIGVGSCAGGTEQSVENDETSVSQQKNDGVKLVHGELLDIKKGDVTIIKAKIKPSYNNDATINQNYYNIEDLIKNQGFDKCQQIQYWAVADMESGSESKVISFTVNKDLIDKIAKEEVFGISMGDYVDELWLHPSLR